MYKHWRESEEREREGGWDIRVANTNVASVAPLAPQKLWSKVAQFRPAYWNYTLVTIQAQNVSTQFLIAARVQK